MEKDRINLTLEEQDLIVSTLLSVIKNHGQNYTFFGDKYKHSIQDYIRLVDKFIGETK